MADTTTWEDDLAAALDDSAPDEAAMAAAPDSDIAPDDDPQIAADETPDETVTEAVETADAVETEPEAEPAPVVAEATAPPVNWDSPDNPHFLRAQQAERVLQLAQERRAQQLAQEAEQARLERVKALADDDPARVMEIEQVITESARPYVAQVQKVEGELEVVSKVATVLDAAMRLTLSPEQQATVQAEVERLMQLPGGYSNLTHHIETRKGIEAKFTSELEQLRAENAELKKRTAAKQQIAQRAATGADLVDSGAAGNLSSYQARWDAASGEDALDVILDSLAS